MIDLHIHTIYSDGTDSLEELLTKAQQANLQVISVTDHNTCQAYEALHKIDVKKYYKGNIIVGCEFTTVFDGHLIEVLGYGFDIKRVSEFLKKIYSPDLIKERVTILYQRLLKKIEENGLIYSKGNQVTLSGQTEFFERQVYEELIKHPENVEILQEDIFKSFSDFYRKGLTNKKSKLFINHIEFKPSIKEIVDLIHDAGGIVFLAHPYQYKLMDTEGFLNKLYNTIDLDGIECFYTTFTRKQTEYLLHFARERQLLTSGGSDYHGTNKKMHDLGVGRGNLEISEEILKKWPIQV